MTVLERSARNPDVTLTYGEHPQQVIDVWLPATDTDHRLQINDADTDNSGQPIGGIVLCLHGGFWREKYDRMHLAPFSEALALRGHVVAVPEYRRVGGDGGWPTTFDDVAAVADVAPLLIRNVLPAECGQIPIALVGHSAGGHLALWVVQRHNLPAESTWRTEDAPRFVGVVALAPVADLVQAQRLHLSDDAVVELIGGTFEEVPKRYVSADTRQLVPPSVPVEVLHGSADDIVPVDIARSYVDAARTVNAEVSLTVLEGAGHFDLIDPISTYWPDVFRSIEAAQASQIQPAPRSAQ